MSYAVNVDKIYKDKLINELLDANVSGKDYKLIKRRLEVQLQREKAGEFPMGSIKLVCSDD